MFKTSHTFTVNAPKKEDSAPVPRMAVAARNSTPRQHTGETNTTFRNREPLNADSFKRMSTEIPEPGSLNADPPPKPPRIFAETRLPKTEETPSHHGTPAPLPIQSLRQNPLSYKAENRFPEIKPDAEMSAEISEPGSLNAHPRPRLQQTPAEGIRSEPESVHPASSQRKQTRLKIFWKFLKGLFRFPLASRKTLAQRGELERLQAELRAKTRELNKREAELEKRERAELRSILVIQERLKSLDEITKNIKAAEPALRTIDEIIGLEREMSRLSRTSDQVAAILKRQYELSYTLKEQTSSLPGIINNRKRNPVYPLETEIDQKKKLSSLGTLVA